MNDPNASNLYAGQRFTVNGIDVFVAQDTPARPGLKPIVASAWETDGQVNRSLVFLAPDLDDATLTRIAAIAAAEGPRLLAQAAEPTPANALFVSKAEADTYRANRTGMSLMDAYGELMDAKRAAQGTG